MPLPIPPKQLGVKTESSQLQDHIDAHLNYKSDPSSNVTEPIGVVVAKGMKGKFTLPIGVDMKLYGCEIKKAILEGNNTVYAEDCDIFELDAGRNCTINLFNCRLKVPA